MMTIQSCRPPVLTLRTGGKVRDRKSARRLSFHFIRYARACGHTGADPGTYLEAIVTMQSPRIAVRPTNWRGKGLLRVLLIVVTAIAIAALASFFGVARDYGYLRST